MARWTIKQTRLLYADLGLTEHQDSARIARFVQRFGSAGWVSPRMVRSWSSGRVKPNAKECRQFMELLVSLGYGVGNGLSGRDFRIRITHNFIGGSPFSPKQAQTHTGHSVELSPKCSPLLVQFSPLEENVKPVETDYADYERTTKRTTLKPSPDNDLMAKRTNGLIIVGDRVRYRGRGERGLFTLKGIWSDVLTVVAVKESVVEVSSPMWLSTQSLPIADVEVWNESW